MKETKTKIDANTLEIITETDPTTRTITRDEIQTLLYHRELDKIRVQSDIDDFQADLDLLNK